MSDSSSKTEKPTPERLKKARKEGQFLSSKDLVGAAQFAVFVLLLVHYTPQWMLEARATTAAIFRAAFRQDLGKLYFTQLGVESMTRLFYPLAVAALLLTLIGLLVQFSTTRFGFSVKSLAPSLKRMNPMSNLKQLPRRNVPAATQALAMIVIFSAAIWFIVRDSLGSLMAIPMVGLARSLPVAGEALTSLVWRAAAVFVLFGLIDIGRQFRRRQKDLRMSKQEIKEEYKKNEGDPQIKSRVQGLRREMLRNQMLKEVPRATAVIVNPTHYAVALRYEHGAGAVPLVVAKGRNHFALRIRELARSSGVPIIENKPLAQAVYKSVRVGQEIPAHLYRAVAEVLAYVYRVMQESESQSNRPEPAGIRRIP